MGCDNALCENCRHKEKPRSEEYKKSLQNRINRITGQLGGIKRMIDDNRYCGDILIQISASEKALENLAYIILSDHLSTCVSDKIKSGDETIINETMELIKRIK